MEIYDHSRLHNELNSCLTNLPLLLLNMHINYLYFKLHSNGFGHDCVALPEGLDLHGGFFSFYLQT